MGRARESLALGAVLVLLGCDPSGDSSEEPVAAPGLDVIAGISESGLYRVSLRPRYGDVRIGHMHAWIVSVETVAGRPFSATRLAFDGGMPQHQHGFVTAPRVTRALGPGEYLIEGVKFHMSGDWTLRIEVVGPDGPDVAVLHAQVGP